LNAIPNYVQDALTRALLNSRQVSVAAGCHARISKYSSLHKILGSMNKTATYHLETTLLGSENFHISHVCPPFVCSCWEKYIHSVYIYVYIYIRLFWAALSTPKRFNRRVIGDGLRHVSWIEGYNCNRSIQELNYPTTRTTHPRLS
jgi:hypothetical protein